MRSSRTTSIRLAAVIGPRAGSDPRQQDPAANTHRQLLQQGPAN
ncbi:hypothetical protein [Paenibacillus vietnamensis]|nr:hypothetical protein [Paenibacillus vietnamensis]